MFLGSEAIQKKRQSIYSPCLMIDYTEQFRTVFPSSPTQQFPTKRQDKATSPAQRFVNGIQTPAAGKLIVFSKQVSICLKVGVIEDI
jgi:hypothetical protein